MKPVLKKIYSENNDYQHLDVLKRNREKRNKYQEFLVEGVKPIEQALQNNWKIKAFVFSSKRKLSQWACRILETSTAQIHYDLPLELMEKLSDKEDCSEIIAVAAIPGDDRDKIELGPNPLLVVFDRPSSHGNLGTIIRSCDSLKVNGLILTGHGVDLYDPQTIRASLGSIFTIPIIRLTPNELFAWFTDIKKKSPDLQLIGTSAKADQKVDELNFTKPTVLFLGNETDGLSKNYKSACDTLITIPIYGSATSLNVACAASICLYEIDRQRRRA
jgi:TrmH family RNA methyltransferase